VHSAGSLTYQGTQTEAAPARSRRYRRRVGASDGSEPGLVGQQTGSKRLNLLRSTMRSRNREKPEKRLNRAIARPSSPIVVTLEPACPAGGRGFESRRSRKTPCKSACGVVGSRRQSPVLAGAWRSAARTSETWIAATGERWRAWRSATRWPRLRVLLAVPRPARAAGGGPGCAEVVPRTLPPADES
jgi:hypothetical protein